MNNNNKVHGKVTLVGAGPGNIELITLKGIKALKNADVVIYDRLISSDILNLIPQSAEKINAGKQNGKHNIRQEDINKILLEKALDGKNVIRLKGGDCFLFGRGAEELEILYNNSIDFEVIPGISSAFAVPCYAGIPITHRDFSSSVHIITGHSKENQELKIDFKSYAKLDGTLIFLMGLSNIKYIMDNLIKNGMPDNTPCAIIENGTTPIQRKIISDIKSISKEAESQNIKSPAIIIVGKVCDLSNKFDWFQKLPLFGKNIVVTRPKNRAKDLYLKLVNIGACVTLYPCIEIIGINDNLKMINDIISNFDWVVFTSPSGVEIVFEYLFKNGFDSRVFSKKNIAAIGSGTSKELKKYGIIADIIPDSYNGKSLGIKLVECARRKNVILLRAENGSKEIKNQLKKAKINYRDFPVYRTIYRNSDNIGMSEKINSGNIDFVIFTSASTIHAFVKTVHADFKLFKAVCIGQKTAEAAKKYKMDFVVSENASIESIIEKIKFVSDIR